VDELKTSDELLINALDEFDIYEIKTEVKKGIQDRLFGGLFATANRLLAKLADAQNGSRYH